MTQNILFGIGLLFAIYGISMVILKIVIWLTTPKNNDKCLIIVPITDVAQIQDRMLSAELRSELLGSTHFKKIIAVNCGLEGVEYKKFIKYCEYENILYCELKDLSEYVCQDVCKS